MAQDTIPVKELILEENSGVKTIAFVDRPAIMVNWVAFNEQKELKFAVQNEDQKTILSPALIPGLHIPRTDIHGATFVVTMNEQTIADVAFRWMKEGRQNFANVMHDSGQELDGITWFSSFVSDGKNILNPPAFESLPTGTWFLMGKVNNPDVWAKVKDGTFKGISIEGIFSMLESPSLTVEQVDAITESIVGYDA